MRNPSIRQLRYFEALANHGHFGRAAEACSISQPALSVQIREIESLLGAPLVERSGRQTRLTPLGEEFANRARVILRKVDELAELAQTSHGVPVGRLRIGVIPTVAPYCLPRLMQQLTAHFPAIDLLPREAVTQKLLEDLVEHRLDAAIVALPVSEDTLVEWPLFNENFVLVRPLADADKPIPNPETLNRMKLLLLEEGHCFREQALSFCKGSGPMPRVVMEGCSLSTLVQMVSVGLGVTLIPEMAVAIETRSVPVCVSQLANPRPSRTIGMVWRRSTPMAAQFVQIAELLK
ncbi:LysR Transcriptional regulator [Rhabdaerophilaceae bacterium]